MIRVKGTLYLEDHEEADYGLLYELYGVAALPAVREALEMVRSQVEDYRRDEAREPAVAGDGPAISLAAKARDFARHRAIMGYVHQPPWEPPEEDFVQQAVLRASSRERGDKPSKPNKRKRA